MLAWIPARKEMIVKKAEPFVEAAAKGKKEKKGEKEEGG